MAETLSEQVGLHKEIDGTNKRTVNRPVTVETENREYVADPEKWSALNTKASGCGVGASTVGDGPHPSMFWQDPHHHGVKPIIVVRRSLTWREAFKALFTKEIDRPLVAIEIEVEGNQNDITPNLDDSFV